MTPPEPRPPRLYYTQSDIDNIQNIEDVKKILNDMMKFIIHIYEISKEK